MPLWLLTAWPYVKRALPYIAIILGIVSAYWWANDRGRAAQRAKDNPTIFALIAADHRAADSLRAVTAALNDKNAESIARAKAYTASKAQDAKDIASANSRWARSAGNRATLDKLSHQASVGDCVVPKALSDALGDL